MAPVIPNNSYGIHAVANSVSQLTPPSTMHDKPLTTAVPNNSYVVTAMANPANISQATPAVPNNSYGINPLTNSLSQVAAPSHGTNNLTDILAISELAAKALSDQKGKRDPRATHYTQTSASKTQSYSHANSQEQDVNVTVKDLSVMVQLSLQNLQASGMLDKEIGQNACRWLKQLSEPLALQCLER